MIYARPSVMAAASVALMLLCLAFPPNLGCAAFDLEGFEQSASASLRNMDGAVTYITGGHVHRLPALNRYYADSSKFPSGRENEHLRLTDKYDMCLVSFGEHEGQFVVHWRASKPHQPILAIEPQPVIFARLNRNVLGLNITTHHYCVSDGYKEVTFPATNGLSGTRAGGNAQVGQGKYAIKCVPIELLLRNFPDCFFKIDVEGHEAFLMDALIGTLF